METESMLRAAVYLAKYFSNSWMDHCDRDNSSQMPFKQAFTHRINAMTAEIYWVMHSK